MNSKQKPIPAQVQRQQKQVHYTVSIIGGKEDLAQWKADRARIDAEYAKAASSRYEARRAAAVSAVESQIAIRDNLSETEKVETIHIDNRSKKAHSHAGGVVQYENYSAMQEKQLDKNNCIAPYNNSCTPKKAPTYTQKLREACTKLVKSLWKSANFNNN